MTFDKMCREKWIFIARSHGLEIEDTPKPRDEVGKTLEEISNWDELMPSIQNFREWTKER